MSSLAPWLAHYDAGVPATLAPYPDPHAPRLPRRRGAGPPGRAGAALQGRDDHLRRARATERRVRGRASRRSASGAAIGRAAAAQLPAVLHRRVRRVEARRDRRAAQSDLHGARARRAAPRARRRDDRHADAVLRAGQEHPEADAAAPGHRDQHQGILSAAAARAVHARSRETRRRSRLARARRSRSRAPAAGQPRPASRARSADDRTIRRCC